jgi:hypothetical protein
MNVRIVEEGHTVIILGQLELFAVIDMLGAAAGQTDGRLSHDLAGFGSAIADPIRAKLSEAMVGIAGEYHESVEFDVSTEVQGIIDKIMTKIYFGDNSSETPSESTEQSNDTAPEKEQQFSKRKVLPDDN